MSMKCGLAAREQVDHEQIVEYQTIRQAVTVDWTKVHNWQKCANYGGQHTFA